MIARPTVFAVVGTPGSGKDLLIQAVNDMGVLHCRIVPKHTNRKRQKDDSNEMICVDDDGYDLENCDLLYSNYNNQYGIKLSLIWDQLKMGGAQIIVVSNVDAINKLIRVFGKLVKLLFVHSEMDERKYRKEQLSLGNSEEYVNARVEAYNQALSIYFRNIVHFDHVLIYADSKEDLFDQIFRLFSYYEGI
jgi:ribose 1,5-bisphosphokinase PhnN